jgi:hypothetical protein
MLMWKIGDYQSGAEEVQMCTQTLIPEIFVVILNMSLNLAPIHALQI